jgi:hypothetical protein
VFWLTLLLGGLGATYFGLAAGGVYALTKYERWQEAKHEARLGAEHVAYCEAQFQERKNDPVEKMPGFTALIPLVDANCYDILARKYGTDAVESSGTVPIPLGATIGEPLPTCTEYFKTHPGYEKLPAGYTPTTTNGEYLCSPKKAK